MHAKTGMVGVACPDRPKVSTHEDNVRSASLQQLDAAEKADSLRSNQDSMKPSDASFPAKSEPVFSSKAAAVSATNITLTSAAGRPKRTQQSRPLANALRPGEIGTNCQRLKYFWLISFGLSRTNDIGCVCVCIFRSAVCINTQ